MEGPGLLTQLTEAIHSLTIGSSFGFAALGVLKEISIANAGELTMLGSDDADEIGRGDGRSVNESSTGRARKRRGE